MVFSDDTWSLICAHQCILSLIIFGTLVFTAAPESASISIKISSACAMVNCTLFLLSYLSSLGILQLRLPRKPDHILFFADSPRQFSCPESGLVSPDHQSLLKFVKQVNTVGCRTPYLPWRILDPLRASSNNTCMLLVRGHLPTVEPNSHRSI